MILSDIGSNTLLHPDTWISGKRTPNRLRALKAYVENGGGPLMVGCYYSFQGINGGARYHGTPVETALPVDILPYDDRVEAPEGFTPVIKQEEHPILAGLQGEWPPLLGFNEVKPKAGAAILATVSADYRQMPLLVAGSFGKGRTQAWTSDIGPHTGCRRNSPPGQATGGFGAKRWIGWSAR